MVFAVLLVLVCVVMAATMLTVSLSGTKKYNKKLEERQEYYSVYSAAKLITDGLGEMSYQKKKYTLGVDGTCGNGKAEHVIPTTKEGVMKISNGVDDVNGVFHEAIEEIVEEIVNGGTGGSENYTISGEGMDDVTVILNIGEDYSLSFSLTCGRNSIVVDYTPTVNTGDQTFNISHTYKVEEVNPETLETEQVDKVCDWSYNEHTTDITWGKAKWTEE